MADHPEPRITLHSLSSRVRILVGETVIADTCNALELCEKGYPPRRYLPRSDVEMAKLSVSHTVTHCPFKGDSTYYSLPDLPDIAWSYDHPIKEMQAIAGRLAFDADKVTLEME
ncbi:DUF427 domain-containing protein [Cobetia crustatorum]|uniref:DUF427 domain-containing protein n=1 Tax=Cobetia crustatorum TaxID=553385 RepID=A0A558HI53_9GAMM|nr:DUF427 domain-containing protein [Cobetia crustatorum]TVU68815.1 DUF427 domain-containing protein [Cobetia crustatorum]